MNGRALDGLLLGLNGCGIVLLLGPIEHIAGQYQRQDQRTLVINGNSLDIAFVDPSRALWSIHVGCLGLAVLSRATGHEGVSE